MGEPSPPQNWRGSGSLSEGLGEIESRPMPLANGRNFWKASGGMVAGGG